jgi:hypothetical protein
VIYVSKAYLRFWEQVTEELIYLYFLYHIIRYDALVFGLLFSVKHYDVGYVLLGRICVYIFCKNIDRTFYKRSSECFVWFDDLGGYLWARFLTVQFLPWLLSWFGSGVLRFFSVFEIRCGCVPNTVGPDAIIIGLSIGVGSGWNGTFDGAIDNASWTISGVTTPWNFETEQATSVTKPTWGGLKSFYR